VKNREDQIVRKKKRIVAWTRATSVCEKDHKVVLSERGPTTGDRVQRWPYGSYSVHYMGLILQDLVLKIHGVIRLSVLIVDAYTK
jgi:hypothetical protein